MQCFISEIGAALFLSFSIELYVEGVPTPINLPIIAQQRHNSIGALVSHETYLHEIACQIARFPISQAKA